MSQIRKTFILFCLLFSAVLGADPVDQSYQFRGVHFIASYCDCDMTALADLEKLTDAMMCAVKKSGATVLEVSSWTFPPNGLTMVFLLSESHASIHTCPEHGACFVDLFTCGEHCSSEQFDIALRDYLKPTAVNLRTLIRNQEIQEK